jgi:hypothetical protein
MTKAYSKPDDNGWMCERCNRPESINEAQIQVPIMLGGGIGMGTMWVCKTCVEKKRDKDSEKADEMRKV